MLRLEVDEVDEAAGEGAPASGVPSKTQLLRDLRDTPKKYVFLMLLSLALSLCSCFVSFSFLLPV
jgi:hypothetical protein